MHRMGLSVVYATFPDRASAQAIARDLVKRRLAACATFWDAGSVYVWEGELEETTETLAFFKTDAGRTQELVHALVEAHPYDVPCVLPLDVDGAPEPYQRWVRDATDQR